jgi:hypothetical protein
VLALPVETNQNALKAVWSLIVSHKDPLVDQDTLPRRGIVEMIHVDIIDTRDPAA